MIWLDAQLSPRLARWIRENLRHEAQAIKEVGLRDAEDDTIFRAARANGVVILTKDKDFAELVTRLGPPPTVIWLRCGNTSEERLRQVLANHLESALAFIAGGETLVEIQ